MRYDLRYLGSLVALLAVPATAQTAPHAAVYATSTPGVDPTGATDSTTGLTNALSAAASGNYELLVPCGTYSVSSLSISGSVVVRGASTVCTKIIGSSATADVLTVTGGPSISNITVDRSVAASAGAGLKSTNGSFPILENITVQNQYVGFWLGATARAYCKFCVAQQNYSDGFYFTDTSSIEAMQWQVINGLSQFNNGWGFNTDPQSTNGWDTGQTFIATGTYANVQGGFNFGGAPSAAINDLIMINAYSSSDGGNGFQFSKPGLFNQLSDIFAELEGRLPTGRGQLTPASGVGNGINFDTAGTTNSSVTINGAILTDNSWTGLQVYQNSTLGTLMVTNLKTIRNGWVNNKVGVMIQSSVTKYLFSNLYSSDDGSGHQAYGLYATSSAAAGNAILSGAYLSGNLTAGCSMAVGQKAAVIGTGC